MNTTPFLPLYSDIEDALQDSSTTYSAAQVHGLMCGLNCALTDQAQLQWEKLLFGNKKLSNLAILEELSEKSYQQMSEFSFDFALLLPGDDAHISTRVEALGLWCQGFLIGLEHSKVPLTDRMPGEITDALNDFLEISQVSFDELTEDEADETDYFELVEYVRLAVLMIFHDLRKTAGEQDTENNMLQ